MEHTVMVDHRLGKDDEAEAHASVEVASLRYPVG